MCVRVWSIISSHVLLPQTHVILWDLVFPIGCHKTAVSKKSSPVWLANDVSHLQLLQDTSFWQKYQKLRLLGYFSARRGLQTDNVMQSARLVKQASLDWV